MKSRTLKELQKIFGKESVLTSKISMETYAYDSSPFIHYPEAVVFAESAEQISRLMILANLEGFVVVPRGAGTCLSGGAVPLYGGVVLSLNRLNRIIEIDRDNEAAWLEPGVTNLALQQAAAAYGLMFGPDPASQKVSTIGGNVAECAGGIRGVKYGVTRDHFLGLEVVLPDGRIINTGSLLARHAPGIDPAGIFCGSEGTFGVMTRILVKLTPLPEEIRTMMAVFNSLESAGEAVSRTISRGIVPTTLEIMDQAMIRAVDDFIKVGFPRDAEAVLLIEVDGYRVEVERQVDTIAEICRECGSTEVRKADGEEERQKLWLARRSGNGALGRIKPSYMVQDVTVPRHRLPEMLRLVSDISREFDIIIAQMAHAGDGNLHPHLLYDPADHQEHDRVIQASQKIFTAALDMGGTLTGEHGIGMEKLDFMPKAFSKEDIDFMELVKRTLDPNLILNRGKVLNMQLV